ncbi:MAG: HAMP domain-containing protein [Rhodospirillales bacterium]|nr:HAMP domain-containing protein [Rhodospirillales bacterium]
MSAVRDIPVRRPLGRTFALALAGGLAAASVALLIVFISLYSGKLADERAQASDQVNRLLQATLENAMLKRDLPGLMEVVERLGRQEGILGVTIVNPKGEIRFASRAESLGAQLDRVTHPGCQGCHNAKGEIVGRTVFIKDELGREVLRSVNPVRNKEPCTQCHGPVAASPVNGVLIVDYDARPIRQAARDTVLVFIAAGAARLLALMLGAWLLVRALVLRPIAGLHHASSALAAGDLEVTVPVKGEDEFALMATTFNGMVASLRSRLAEIHDQKAFLKALIDATPDGIRVIDENWTIMLANRAYGVLVGAGPDDDVGKTCHRSSANRDEPCPPTLIACPIEAIRRTGQPMKAVQEFHRPDGSVIEAEVVAAPLDLVLDGRPRRLVVESCRDLAREIRFSHEQKLSAVGQLATGVAHEIRTPLASIRLALQNLLRTAAQPDAPPGMATFRDYLTLVDGEIDKCIDVTNRLLRLSMVPGEARHLIDVNKAARETLSLLAFEAEQGGVTVIFDLDPAQPRILATESDLRMVVLNLAQNAFHAMPKGGKLILSTRESGGRVGVIVKDTGIGIPPDHLRRVFEPFFSHRADGVNGTGLGLSITKGIVESLGGTIGVESAPGEGATFTLDLPSAATAMEGSAR